MIQLATPTISDLPPEILSSIFLLNTFVSIYVKIPQDITRYTSQVCRQWRLLVLENPIIWSRLINFASGSHQWTEELLRRASDCPLDLVSRYRSLSSDILARELEHVSRFGRYDGEFDEKTWPLVLDKFQQPAPYLEELRLRGHTSGQFKLPATIFSGNAPRLRQLWLQCCSFDADLPYLAQLTRLNVSQVSLRFSPSQKWLDILSRMKFLTNLELRDVNIGMVESYTAVHLPNLENILLRVSLSEARAFLSCLILKPTCRMRVTAQDCCPGTDFDITAGIIAQKLQPSLAKTTETDFPLLLYFSNDHFLISNRPNGAASAPETPPYVFFRACWPSHETGLSILPHVSPAFAGPLAQVTSLRLLFKPDLAFTTHSAIANVLRHANKVTSLIHLDEQAANVFLQFEGVRRPISTQTGGDVIFPSLRAMCFTDVGIDEDAGTDRVLESLVDFIQYRISIAAPIGEVYYTKLFDVSWVQHGMECLRETGVLVAQRNV